MLLQHWNIEHSCNDEHENGEVDGYMYRIASQLARKEERKEERKKERNEGRKEGRKKEKKKKGRKEEGRSANQQALSRSFFRLHHSHDCGDGLSRLINAYL